MDKIWFENKLKECESVRPEIEKLVKSLNMSDKDYQRVIGELDKDYGNMMSILNLAYMMYCGENNDFVEDYDNLQKWIKDSKIESLIRKYKERYFLENCLDMSMEFDGNILITDPC